jgi:hypothetical protein
MTFLRSTVCLVWFLLSALGQGTTFLDHDKPIEGLDAKSWLKEQIPFIDIPEEVLQSVYYYRWSVTQRHLRYGYPGHGYVMTEFTVPIGYESKLGGLSDAAGHQVYEGRWLRDPGPVKDFVRLWTRGGGNSNQYTHWILDSGLGLAQVTGDADFLVEQLEGMKHVFDKWRDYYDEDSGLYYFTPFYDAQEYSLPSYVWGDEEDLATGPMTYRPSLNSYMVANARAIAAVADLASDSETSDNYTSVADDLEKAVLKHLWDPEQKFFVDVIKPENPNLEPISGREEVGFYPFRFGIGLESDYMDPTIDQLNDPKGFNTEFGPPTIEARNQYYHAEKPDDYCCYWNGQSWPFSTGHTLSSLATIYHTGKSKLTGDQYLDVLRKYARTQHRDGVPYIAEAHYPERDSWSGDSFNHSEHYLHSTYNDNILSGLLGVTPSLEDKLQVKPIVPDNWTYFAVENLPYHGHLLTILYDKAGTRYNEGKGLSVYSDGVLIHNQDYLSEPVNIDLSKGNKGTTSTKVNVARNPQMGEGYPRLSTNSTNDNDTLFMVNDGLVLFDDIPFNRWESHSTSQADLLNVTFARPRKIDSITLAVFADENREVACPESISLSADGKPISHKGFSCTPNDFNHIQFTEDVEIRTISITLHHKQGYGISLSEVQVWVEPNNGPTYYAVDGITNGCKVVESNNEIGYAVNPTGDLQLEIGGVTSESDGTKTISLSYKNPGKDAAISASVNDNISSTNLTLKNTDDKFASTEFSVTLNKGINYITFTGGSNDLLLDSIAV